MKNNLLKQIPNFITILRIIFSLIFSFMLYISFTHNATNFIIPLLLFIIIMLTDILDGNIARRTNNATDFGARLDVSADLFFVVSADIVLIYCEVLPLWFLIFSVLKFVEFILTSRYAKLHSTNSLEHIFVFDKLGKSVSIICFIIPGIICVFYSFIPFVVEFIIQIIIYITLIGGIISSVYRIKKCYDLN